MSKKSNEKKDSTTSSSASIPATAASPPIPNVSGTEILNYISQLDAVQQKQAKREAKLRGEDSKEHKFWNTQPVLHEDAVVVDSGPIEVKVLEDVRKEPLNMPPGFEWSVIDIRDDAQIAEMYTLLTENYVEDDDCTFRFDYSVNFLRWALSPPGYVAEWHVGVRNSKTGKLMGCITGIPALIGVDGTEVPMAEINFLCVHKKLRDKRLAPVLIKEITRRVNCRGVWQATYTAGVVLPKPVARCRYYHRSLNPKKLIEARFSYLPQKTTMTSHLRNLRLNATISSSLQPMKPEHVPSAHNLLSEYLQRTTKLYTVFNVEEFAHVFLPQEAVVDTFVIVGTDGNVTDMCSFYHLPSSILGNPLHTKLFAVYSYYNIATTISFEVLMSDALILARDKGVDVFNALDVMENLMIMDSLKFGIGDGYLQYYLYNWRSPEKTSSEIGLVLL